MSQQGMEDCELCGDVPDVLFLRARCHPTAPLRVRKEGNVLILSCYIPACAREVARFEVVEKPTRRHT